MQTARYGRNRRFHSAGEAALPGQYFNERHGTASVYRVWRSHPLLLSLRAVIRVCGLGPRAGRSAKTPARNAQTRAKIRKRRRRHRDRCRVRRKTVPNFVSRALSGPPSSPINAPNHRGRSPSMAPSGEVAEWLNAPHSKCGIGASLSGVRIPPSPPPSSPRQMVRAFDLQRSVATCDPAELGRTPLQRTSGRLRHRRSAPWLRYYRCAVWAYLNLRKIKPSAHTPRPPGSTRRLFPVVACC